LELPTGKTLLNTPFGNSFDPYGATLDAWLFADQDDGPAKVVPNAKSDGK
jgi:hypothetical protein